MTQRPTALRIASPCPESWADMTPAGPGRHCATCQKTVVDFTHQTDAEILAHIRQAGAGATCGRFQANQLAQPVRPAYPAPRPARWQTWLAGWLVAALATQGCQPTPPGEPLPREVTLAAARNSDSVAMTLDSAVVAGIADSLGNVITGQVYALASHRPVSQASVQLQHTSLTAITDATGHFVIRLPESLPMPGAIVLRLAAAGYAPQTLVAGSEPLPTHGLAIAQLSYPLPQMLLGAPMEQPAGNN